MTLLSNKNQQKPLMDAQWCRAMATLLASGLSPEQTFIALQGQAGHNNSPLADACHNASLDVAQGLSLITALSRQHFFNRYQLEQIKIGELSGCLPVTLINIGHRLSKQDARNKKLKAQLKLSQAIIVIGLTAGMVITSIKGGDILYGLLGLMIIVMVTKRIYAVLDGDVFSLIASVWRSPTLINHVSVFKRLFEYYWYSLLAAQLDAGIDPVHALMNLQGLFPSTLLQRQARVAQRSLEKGNSLLSSLSQAQLILTQPLRQTLWIGEKTGLLAPTLNYYLELEAQKLEIIAATVYEWLPKLYYVMAVSIVLHVMM